MAENINGMVAALQEKIRAADEEKQKLESVFAGMAEGVMVLDPDLRIETLNRGMEEMIRRPAREMVGRTILEAFRNIPLQDALERFRETGETVSQEISLGEDRPLVADVTISAVRSKRDGERKTILVFHDVTRLKKLERIRTDFVANVTHEIKTPLTAIIGFVETLQRGAIGDREKALEFLQTIQANAQRLNRLVDDLLTLSGIELGEANAPLREAVRRGCPGSRPGGRRGAGVGKALADRQRDSRGAAGDPGRPRPAGTDPAEHPGQCRQIHARRRDGFPGRGAG